MSESWNTTVKNWQGVDEIPLLYSNNLPKSKGVFEMGDTIKDEMNGLTIVEPTLTVDGYYIRVLNSAIVPNNNSNYSYQKYAVSSDNLYYFSGVMGNNSNLYMIHYEDSEGNYISREFFPYQSENNPVVYNNVFLDVPSNAAYIYLNCHATYDNIGIVKAKPIKVENVTVPYLQLKSYGLDNIEKLDCVYCSSSGLSRKSKNMMCLIFKVNPNTKYKYSISVINNPSSSHYILWYLDSSKSPIGSDSGRAVAGEDVVIDNKEITTPDGCRYVAFNVRYVNAESAKFELVDIITELNNISPDYKVIEPYEIVKNKYIKVENDIFAETDTMTGQYSKYYVNPNKSYVVSGMIMSTLNGYIIYFADTNGNYISRQFRNRTGHDLVVDKYPITISNTDVAIMYVNMRIDSPLIIREYIGESEDWDIASTYDDTDRTSEILEVLGKKKSCKLGKGDFYVNNLVMPDNTTLTGIGKSTRIVLDNSDLTATAYAIKVGKQCTISDMCIDGGEELVYKGEENISIDSIQMHGNRHGILLLGNGESDREAYAGTVITRCDITNFRGGGITCDNSGYSTYSSLTVSDCWIRNCCVGINIAYFSEFNKFNNVGCVQCRYGCINQGGNNSFCNCGFDSNMIGFYMNGGDGKCIRYDGSTKNGTNMGHGIMYDCTIVHNGKSNAEPAYSIVVIDVSPGFMFSGFDGGYGKFYFKHSSYICFNNARLGHSSGFEIVNMNTPMIISNVLGVGDAFTPFAVYENDQLVTTFDSDGNTPKVFMRDCFLGNQRATPQYLMSLL